MPRAIFWLWFNPVKLSKGPKPPVLPPEYGEEDEERRTGGRRELLPLRLVTNCAEGLPLLDVNGLGAEELSLDDDDELNAEELDEDDTEDSLEEEEEDDEDDSAAVEEEEEDDDELDSACTSVAGERTRAAMHMTSNTY